MAFNKIAVKWTRYFVIGTLLIGQGIHGLRLILSHDVFHQYVFTPTFDSLFALPMIVAAIGMVKVWRHIRYRNKFERVAVGFSTFYFIASVPNHAQVWFTQFTGYIDWFPLWFSVVFFCYTIPLLIVWARLQIEANPIPKRQVA